MKKLFREYNRLKKFARTMEGNLRPEVMQAFLDEVNEEALTQLKVRKEDLKKLKRVNPEKQIMILSPYLEGYLKQIAEEKINQKLQMAKELAQATVCATVAGDGCYLLARTPHGLAGQD